MVCEEFEQEAPRRQQKKKTVSNQSAKYMVYADVCGGHLGGGIKWQWGSINQSIS